MKKVCWIMHIKPDKKKEYIEIHKKGNVWIGVLKAMKEAGFKKMAIFIYEYLVIIYTEVDDFEKAIQYLAKDPNAIKWNKISLNMMDNIPDFNLNKSILKLPLIFDFEKGEQLNN